MRILLLGAGAKNFRPFLESRGETTEAIDTALTRSVDIRESDFVVSYGYRFLLSEDQLKFFQRVPINLHISLLPWNRGADPNFWSFLENTPKGVTIHEIDRGTDTGNILLQKEVKFSNEETLRSTYSKLCGEIENLFMENWEALRNDQIKPVPQRGPSTVHRRSDLENHKHLLTQGWDTPIRSLTRKT